MASNSVTCRCRKVYATTCPTFQLSAVAASKRLYREAAVVRSRSAAKGARLHWSCADAAIVWCGN